MKAGILIASLVLVSACAAPSEKQIEAREYREAEKQAEFQDFHRRCLRSGGILVVEASKGRLKRNSLPAHADSVSCQRGLSLR
jgi:hypothetical protein